MLTDVEGMAPETLVWERDRVRRQLKKKRAELKRLEAELGRRDYVPDALEVTGDVASLEGPARATARFPGNGRWLHLERVKCGKPRCKKCADGVGHGPYYYLYLTNPRTGRHTSKYVGKPVNLTPEMREEFGIEVEEVEG